MNKKIAGLLSLIMAGFVFLGITTPVSTFAEEDQGEQTEQTEESTEAPGTNISLTPVSKVLEIASDSSYEDVFTITNNGSEEMKIEVYAAPYSYVYSEDEDAYKLGFSSENSFTQISRWITFENEFGAYDKKPQYTIQPGKSLDIKYKISTPSNIPAGGQYAVLFAHTLTSVVSSNGIRTEASPGLVLYARSSEGQSISTAEISSLEIAQTVEENQKVRTAFHASAKVKNTGNIDFSAVGTMKVEPIIFGPSYETPSDRGRVSIIPETELVVSDTWDETPDFGLYKVTWTVSAGDKTETIERIIFLFSPIALIITILLLTIVVVWIIIMLRKRKERRSRLAV